MIYLLILALLIILWMGYHIMYCHSEIEELKECVRITSNSLDRERTHNIVQLDKIKSLEKELYGDSNVDSQFRRCGPIIPIQAIPDLIKKGEYCLGARMTKEHIKFHDDLVNCSFGENVLKENEDGA